MILSSVRDQSEICDFTVSKANHVIQHGSDCPFAVCRDTGGTKTGTDTDERQIRIPEIGFRLFVGSLADQDRTRKTVREKITMNFGHGHLQDFFPVHQCHIIAQIKCRIADPWGSFLCLTLSYLSWELCLTGPSSPSP